jgi:hypothetical protein
MIQHQLKLKLNKEQVDTLNRWLWHLASVHNWAIRKIQLDARDSVYYSRKEFQNLLANHSDRLGIPSHVCKGSYVSLMMPGSGVSKRKLVNQGSRVSVTS